MGGEDFSAYTHIVPCAFVALGGGGEFVCSRHGIDWELAPGDKVRITWAPEDACPVDVPEARPQAGEEA